MSVQIARPANMHTIWLPVAQGYTVYVGQLVYFDPGVGLKPFPSASGTPDTDKPLGVVVGVDLKKPPYSTTYSSDYVTGVQGQAAQVARECVGVQGMWAVGDPMAKAQVFMISPDVALKVSITNATQFNPSAVGSNGESLTKSGLTVATNNAIVYCRSGLNQGVYRLVTTYASNVISFDTYWPRTLATTDTFVIANVGLGLSKVDFTNGYSITGNSALSNYYNVIVEEVNLVESGNEYAIIRFV